MSTEPSGPAGAVLPLRVLVVDDEPHMQRHVGRLLGRALGVEIVGVAGHGAEAVAAIRALGPDLVFLDVQMPGMTGVEVARTIGADAMPVAVFVTASDRHAVEAFDVAAVDYLVKPFDDERFARALARGQQAVVARRAGLVGGPPTTAVPGAPSGAHAAERPGHESEHGTRRIQPYAERLAVEVAGQVRPVPVAEIQYVTASGVYAELHVAGRRYLIREPMQALESRLDPTLFMRVHRSAIVRLDQVEKFRRVPGGFGEVRLRTGVWLRVSRSRRAALERWLGIAAD